MLRSSRSTRRHITETTGLLLTASLFAQTNAMTVCPIAPPSRTTASGVALSSKPPFSFLKYRHARHQHSHSLTQAGSGGGATFWWEYPRSDCGYDDVGNTSCAGNTIEGCKAMCVNTTGAPPLATRMFTPRRTPSAARCGFQAVFRRWRGVCSGGSSLHHTHPTNVLVAVAASSPVPVQTRRRLVPLRAPPARCRCRPTWHVAVPHGTCHARGPPAGPPTPRFARSTGASWHHVGLCSLPGDDSRCLLEFVPACSLGCAPLSRRGPRPPTAQVQNAAVAAPGANT